MNELKIGGGNINDIINNSVDFLKNNRGVIAQTALGVVELYGAMEGVEYAKEVGNNFLSDALFIPYTAGIFNILFGLWTRPLFNVLYRNPFIEKQIKKGDLLPEDREKEKEKYGFFSNKNFYCITQFLIVSLVNKYRSNKKHKT